MVWSEWIVSQLPTQILNSCRTLCTYLAIYQFREPVSYTVTTHTFYINTLNTLPATVKFADPHKIIVCSQFLSISYFQNMSTSSDIPMKLNLYDV